ncbi:PREDICTED: sterile alpha motif domain-containing protein 12-like [Priapulus caudatus]|uniref:Sterile alpha motif domain-containing protein 12-like n=1 Tax=Priapulus caudatus TaxID=37621 RepID=A0ABM1E410_PRICU|nr:PREDICTED: sterile alpha motif domain-containing protein 12-like [Priapulus caudatus]
MAHENAHMSTSKRRESTTSSTSSSGRDKRKSKQKPVYFWSTQDVVRWMKKQLPEMEALYASRFLDNDISGRVLVRLNEDRLEQLGIVDREHRQEIEKQIIRIKLNRDVHELKLLQQKGSIFQR